VAPDLTGSSAVADAAALGLAALAEMLAGAHEGIAIADTNRRWVYANPAACQMLGRPLAQIRGEDFLSSVPAREHNFVLGRFADLLGGAPTRFSSVLIDSDGNERETVHSISATEIGGTPHAVAIFRDVTGTRAATRAGVALTQAASQLVGARGSDEILAGIARHAVEGTRALACGLAVVGDGVLDDAQKLSVAGGYGHDQGLPAAREQPTRADRAAQEQASAQEDGVYARLRRHLDDADAGTVIELMTAGSITLSGVPGKPVVLPDARAVWAANPLTEPFVATLDGLGWQAGVYLPLSWENRVIGVFGVYLPSGVAGPSEEELAFYTALADQAAVAVTNARLSAQARQAAALLERTRLARELHDSVSQGLFSMTMHARAAQLAMVRAGLDETGPLGRAITELGELTRGALAEMRALIFELRPAALAEEGLVAALGKQAAAQSAREQVAITVDGPEERLNVGPGVEEHLYRIVSEAMQNVVRHAGADRAAVAVTADEGVLRVVVSDDGAGFDPGSEHPGHLGLSTMAERAEAIGAELDVTSATGNGTVVVLSLVHERRDQGKAALDAC
jgi:PAS domain S-box-containing protein